MSCVTPQWHGLYWKQLDDSTRPLPLVLVLKWASSVQTNALLSKSLLCKGVIRWVLEQNTGILRRTEAASLFFVLFLRAFTVGHGSAVLFQQKVHFNSHTSELHKMLCKKWFSVDKEFLYGLNHNGHLCDLIKEMDADADYTGHLRWVSKYIWKENVNKGVTEVKQEWKKQTLVTD